MFTQESRSASAHVRCPHPVEERWGIPVVSDAPGTARDDVLSWFFHDGVGVLCRCPAALQQPDDQPYRFEREEGEEQVEDEAHPADSGPRQGNGRSLGQDAAETAGGQGEDDQDDGQDGQPAPSAAGPSRRAHQPPPEVAG